MPARWSSGTGYRSGRKVLRLRVCVCAHRAAINPVSQGRALTRWTAVSCGWVLGVLRVRLQDSSEIKIVGRNSHSKSIVAIIAKQRPSPAHCRRLPAHAHLALRPWRRGACSARPRAARRASIHHSLLWLSPRLARLDPLPCRRRDAIRDGDATRGARREARRSNEEKPGQGKLRFRWEG